MHLSTHPMALLRSEAARYGCITIRQASDAAKDSKVSMATTVAAMRRVRTRQGVMQFLTLEDETGILEAVLLPPAYLRVGEQVTTPGPFLVKGKIHQQQGAFYVEVIELYPFYKRKDPFRKD
jgi:error-prone DNA polymerase